MKTPTPSMDDKKTPSPPIRTTEEYDADKAVGILNSKRPHSMPVDYLDNLPVKQK